MVGLSDSTVLAKKRRARAPTLNIVAGHIYRVRSHGIRTCLPACPPHAVRRIIRGTASAGLFRFAGWQAPLVRATVDGLSRGRSRGRNAAARGSADSGTGRGGCKAGCAGRAPQEGPLTHPVPPNSSLFYRREIAAWELIHFVGACHICTGTELALSLSAPGISLLPTDSDAWPCLAFGPSVQRAAAEVDPARAQRLQELHMTAQSFRRRASSSAPPPSPLNVLARRPFVRPHAPPPVPAGSTSTTAHACIAR